VKIIRNRGLTSRYQQNLNALQRAFTTEKRASVAYYYQEFLLNYEIHDVQSLNNRAKGDLHIPPTLQSLDTYYLAQRLELLNSLLLQQKITPLESSAQLLAPITGLPPHQVNEEHPLLLIAWKIHLQLQVPIPRAGAFSEILTLLQKYDDQLDAMVLQQFYAYLRNICTLLMQQGSIDFAPILHHIQRDNLERGSLFHQAKLSPSAYMSVTKTAILVGAFEWALNFIETYKTRLLDAGEDAENYYGLIKAQYFFATGQYEAALDVLPAHFADLMYLINGKRLELKIYYELESPLLSYRIDAYKMYISRSSGKMFSPKIRELERNFINLLLQIQQCTQGDSPRVARIISRIKEKKYLAERDWLLEKVQAKSR